MSAITSFLRHEVIPALGCTEPGAVALAVSRAREALGSAETVVSIAVRVSDSVYKNGKDVGIPGVEGARGNEVAAALGALCGGSDQGLQLLRSCCPEAIDEALGWLKQGRVVIEHAAGEPGVYVEAHVRSEAHEAVAVIQGEHSHICEVSHDGVCLYSAPRLATDSCTGLDGIEIPSFAALYEYVEDLSADDQEYLLEGVRMNRAVADAGLTMGGTKTGSLIGAMSELKTSGLIGADLGYRIRMACIAASEYRMSGGCLPVMSSGGSGNAGITAILPVALAAENGGGDGSVLARAVAVSHLTTSYIKSRIGRLAPVCGCVVAAGSGAAAGICKLHGAPANTAAEAIRMLLSNSAGLFCDGAKESCALKVGTAAHEAYLSAMMVMRGARIGGAQGLADLTVEQTIDNVARINAEGLGVLDKVMISILENRCSCDEEDCA